MLAIRDLAVEFDTAAGPVPAVIDVSMTVHPGQLVAVVGESGSGKSVTALAAMGLLPPSARVARGSVSGGCSPRSGACRKAMIFQEPMSALNPSMTVGEQIAEAVRLHQGLRGRHAMNAAEQALADVGIPDPVARLRQYPHEFSGGMCQRVMIAIALACKPDYLLADEPTTALDVSVQGQILDLIDTLKRDRKLGVLLITHDLGVVGERADVVCVMYRGRVVEYGPACDVLDGPLHPYTRALLACAPRLVGHRRDRLRTVAEMVTPEALRFSTPRGDWTAWWPDFAPGTAIETPMLARVADHRWMCVLRPAGTPADDAPDLPPTLMRPAHADR